MASDSALSAPLGNDVYRLLNMEDREKVIEHEGNLIFCSGLYDACVKIRAFIRGMSPLDIGTLQKYARKLYSDSSFPGVEYSDTAIMICRTDGSIVTMRAKDGFAEKIEMPLDKTKPGINLQTFGVHSREAFENAMKFAETTPCDITLLEKVYASVADEEVGGTLTAYKRAVNGAVTMEIRAVREPLNMRRTFMPIPPRCNVYATDGVFNGKIYAKEGEFTGTIKAAVLDGTIKGGASGGAIKGVSLDIGDGAFTVSQQGDVHIEKGSISWGAVTGTDEIDNRISAAQSAANSALSAADDAQDTADTAYGDFLKLVGGKYTKPTGTFINGTSIKAPIIDGGLIRGTNIYGGKFGDLTDNNDPNVWMEMGIQGFGYGMNVWNKAYKTTPFFSIWDNANGITTLEIKGRNVLEQTPGYITKPKGKWDFSEADSVSGIHFTLA